jgi:hypothetical protein
MQQYFAAAPCELSRCERQLQLAEAGCRTRCCRAFTISTQADLQGRCSSRCGTVRMPSGADGAAPWCGRLPTMQLPGRDARREAAAGSVPACEQR